MASYRRQVHHADAVARARLQIWRHSREVVAVRPADQAAVLGLFAGLRRKIEAVDVPLPDQCTECSGTKSHKMDCSEGRRS